MIVQGTDLLFYQNPVLGGVFEEDVSSRMKQKWSIFWPELENAKIAVQKGTQTTPNAARIHATRILRMLEIKQNLEIEGFNLEDRILPPDWDELVTVCVFPIQILSPIPVEYVVEKESVLTQDMINLDSEDLIIFMIKYNEEEVKNLLSGKKKSKLFEGMGL